MTRCGLGASRLSHVWSERVTGPQTGRRRPSVPWQSAASGVRTESTIIWSRRLRASPWTCISTGTPVVSCIRSNTNWGCLGHIVLAPHQEHRCARRLALANHRLAHPRHHQRLRRDVRRSLAPQHKQQLVILVQERQAHRAEHRRTLGLLGVRQHARLGLRVPQVPVGQEVLRERKRVYQTLQDRVGEAGVAQVGEARREGTRAGDGGGGGAEVVIDKWTGAAGLLRRNNSSGNARILGYMGTRLFF